MAKLKRRWPTRNDLLAWWTFHKIQNATVEELDDPESMKRWIRAFEGQSMHDVHLELYAEYSDFRVEYVNPHYAGYVGPKG